MRLIDVNGNAPALFEKDITQPAGKSTAVWSLPPATRDGTNDTVDIWSAGPNTRTLLRTAVPVNCAIAPAQKITKTPDTGTPPNQTVPVSSNTKLANTQLANTGVREWLLYALAFGLLALVVGSWLTVGFRARSDDDVEDDDHALFIGGQSLACRCPKCTGDQR